MSSKWKVLVIENENLSADILAQVPSQEIQFSLAATAEEGMNQMETNTPNAVIIDLALHGLNGWELLDQMHSKYNPTCCIPAIALAALPSYSLAEEAIDAGFNACIQKPIEASSLMQALHRILSH
jgi:CheY-like chemotaxis protein